MVFASGSLEIASRMLLVGSTGLGGGLIRDEDDYDDEMGYAVFNDALNSL